MLHEQVLISNSWLCTECSKLKVTGSFYMVRSTCSVVYSVTFEMFRINVLSDEICM